MTIDSIRVALRGMLANRMRSLLTMLGILIGTAAVILLVAVGTAALRIALPLVGDRAPDDLSKANLSASANGKDKEYHKAKQPPPEKMVLVVAKAGERDFDTVGAALLWTLEQGLGSDWTPEVEAAWRDAYSLLAGVMRAAAREAVTMTAVTADRRNLDEI